MHCIIVLSEIQWSNYVMLWRSRKTWSIFFEREHDIPHAFCVLILIRLDLKVHFYRHFKWLLLTTMIHGIMYVWKWLHFFQGIFQKLSLFWLYIVTSSMLEYGYLARNTFWVLKLLQSPFAFWFFIEGYNIEQILM